MLKFKYIIYYITCNFIEHLTRTAIFVLKEKGVTKQSFLDIAFSGLQKQIRHIQHKDSFQDNQTKNDQNVL